MMNKNGGYTWVQTCATVVCSPKNADEQNIICINYVASKKENANLIFDCCQYEPVPVEVKEAALKENGAKQNEKSTEGTSTAGASVSNDTTTVESEVRPRLKSTDSKPSEEPVTEDPPPKSTRGRKRKNKAKETTENTTAVEQISNVPTPDTTKISRISPIEVRSDSAVSVNKQIFMWIKKQFHVKQVKNLENAMSKHLTTTTDFSTDALLKQQDAKPASPVHWSGHNSHFYQPTPVPATALLQQLYANRESVIRATTRPSPNGTMYPGKCCR